MDRVFADTSYWIALFNARDALHARSLAASREFSSDRIVTSEMVLTEFLNSFCGYGPTLRRAAAKAVQRLRSSDVVIISQTPELFATALERYRAMEDKAWSLTDCASFLIIEQQRLKAALTRDRHFAQAGFQLLL